MNHKLLILAHQLSNIDVDNLTDDFETKVNYGYLMTIIKHQMDKETEEAFIELTWMK